MAKSKLLLVEGNDDKHVVFALCHRFNVTETFDVIDCKGVEGVFEELPIRFKQSGIETIGVIVDADTDMAARWQRLRQLALPLFPEILQDIPRNGLVHTNADGLTIGVWLMPDNNQNGMLEDFLSFLIPNDDPQLPHVENLLQTIEAENIQGYSVTHRTKAKIHNWLSLQEDPGTPLGQSITKRYLTVDNQICKVFVNWLSSLFS